MQNDLSRVELLVLSSTLNLALLQIVQLKFLFDIVFFSDYSFVLIVPSLTFGSILMLATGISALVGLGTYAGLLKLDFERPAYLSKIPLLVYANFLILAILLMALVDRSLILAFLLLAVIFFISVKDSKKIGVKLF